MATRSGAMLAVKAHVGAADVRRNHPHGAAA